MRTKQLGPGVSVALIGGAVLWTIGAESRPPALVFDRSMQPFMEDGGQAWGSIAIRDDSGRFHFRTEWQVHSDGRRVALVEGTDVKTLIEGSEAQRFRRGELGVTTITPPLHALYRATRFTPVAATDVPASPLSDNRVAQWAEVSLPPGTMGDWQVWVAVSPKSQTVLGAVAQDGSDTLFVKVGGFYPGVQPGPDRFVDGPPSGRSVPRRNFDGTPKERGYIAIPQRTHTTRQIDVEELTDTGAE